MKKYIYVPTASYWPEEDVKNFKKDFFDDIQKFFNDPEVQKSVKENNWDKVFEIWDTDEELNPKNIAEVLAFFLYHFADIDFMSYLKDPYIYSIFEDHIDYVDDF